jgi:dTDP-4-amino-4,6-dideoxygalactose transaminase
MNIPFFSLEAVHQPLKKQFLDAFSRIVDENSYILGKDVEQFESNFAAFCNTNFAIGVGNGLDALKISLKALGIGKGDEVIVPAHTYIATWLAVSEVGAVPVPVDALDDTMNINPALIAEKITAKTKAIIPVHMYGLPCNMDTIMKIANDHKLFVVEDFAQAQGATYKGQKVGSFGDINGTSFYPGKNIGALGDAGAIVTNNEELALKARKIRSYGSLIKYQHEYAGVNSRLDSLQAAFLDIKLKELYNWNAERVRLASLYSTSLKDVGDIKFQFQNSEAKLVYHLFVVRTAQRDKLQYYLNENGVGTIIHYPIPPHLQKAYDYLKLQKGLLPIAENIAETTLSLPLFPGLKDVELTYVCDIIKKFFN